MKNQWPSRGSMKPFSSRQMGGGRHQLESLPQGVLHEVRVREGEFLMEDHTVRNVERDADHKSPRKKEGVPCLYTGCVSGAQNIYNIERVAQIQTTARAGWMG